MCVKILFLIPASTLYETCIPKYLLVPIEIALEYPAKIMNEIKIIRFLWFPVTIPSSIIIFIKYG